jgi:hypothetical protein
MSKYVTFTGIHAAPEPPEPPVCPECKGRCCRDELYYYVNHRVGYYEHDCEACFDGTVPVPVWTAEQERAAVLVWLRGRPGYGPVADSIEEGEHLRGHLKETP